MINNSFVNNFQFTDWKVTRILLVVLAGFYVYAFSYLDLKLAILFCAIPVALIVLGYLFIHPYFTFITLFVYNYFAMGLSRYIPGMWGLGVELLLLFILISVFNHCYGKKYSFTGALNELSAIALFWFIYTVLQLFSPESTSFPGWFMGIRSVSLSFLLVVPLASILVANMRSVNFLLRLWAFFSLFAVAKGWCQLNIGLDWAEQRWMNEGGAMTHLIWSGLRVFSIFTDAGQFGASIGQSGVVFAILAIGKKGWERNFYVLVSLLSIYGMFLSGTRGAIAVPAVGFLFFLVMVRNWKLLIIGSIVLGAVFVGLKYTSIGSGNTQVVRMRTAFNPKDESLQTRLDNQEKIKDYLQDKPFGAGLGSSGSFGREYYPEKYSWRIATDSWFVLIWVQMGIVGLVLHILILLYCLLKGAWITMTNVKDRELYFTNVGLLCGFAGIIAASYGNAVLGQMPTAIICYIGLAITFKSKQFQEEVGRTSEAFLSS